MRTQFTLLFATFLLMSFLTGCQKERSGSALDSRSGNGPSQTFVVSFLPTTINIAQVDSVVVDLISPNAADYRHLTLQKMGDRFATTSTVPEMGYEAFVIIYLRSETNNTYAFLSRQVYGGGKEYIHKAAPKAWADEEGWQLMGHFHNQENEFTALVGIAPANPLLYLYTNPEKRNYIYIDKSYTNNGQHVGSGAYEFTSDSPLPHPIVITNAFASTAATMEGKTWTSLSSLSLIKNVQTGQENIAYFEYFK